MIVSLRFTRPSPKCLPAITVFFGRQLLAALYLLSCLVQNYFLCFDLFLLPLSAMSEKRRKPYVALTLQQRAEIFRLVDQQVNMTSAFDCFQFKIKISIALYRRQEK